ncbi:hypothetical protein HNP84_003226 [Thermocatellispora tengchongensis]|uniref:Glycosyltransferase RgtA/B/C/D-like domain-containing protein n=1 Tax=Thermocatellispora tengchongensis TaxID=1073253 RepID=A0A840P7U1_9ACTN|nr:hypothetical protein [Thermocatellispora tengchongensis]MBB5133500.1 hypothetical protein [Thermocatellispora tengchongensis]
MTRSRVAAPAALLALAAVAYGAGQLLLVPPSLGIGWDEAVYAGQYAAHAPPPLFSAPRARGVPLLVAPVVMLTDSVPVLRLYLAVMSSLALYAAFAVWLRVRHDRSVPLAALLFGGCWLSLFYGPQAMPNLYVALAGVASAGFLVLGGRSRLAPLGLAGSMAVMSLMRPSDALVAAAVLAVAALAVPGWRRIGSLAGLAAGLAVGWGQWSAEAVAAFGGIGARLREAGEHNSAGWTVTVAEHARALDGPTLCRFGADCGPISPVALLWWLAIPAMAGVGLWAARRDGHLGPMLLAAVCGVAMALPYLFYVGYAAPRFLLPAYALLALPVAGAVTALTVTAQPGWPATTAAPPAVRGLAVVVAAGVLAHLALHGAVAHRMAAINVKVREEVRLAAEGLRARGVRPPCMIYGESAVQIGYLIGCDSQGIVRRFGERPAARVSRALTRGDRVVVVYGEVRPPSYVAAWPGGDLPGGLRAHFAP